MTSRYFVEELVDLAEVTLSGQEAHHLLHVVRLKAGEQVVVFDGQGHEADAVIETTSRREAQLRVGNRRAYRPGEMRITLATAAPKGDRLRWLVEKATELGVTCWQPLLTERSVVQPKESRQGRMRQWVIEASRQCRRPFLMEIAPPVGLEDCLNEEFDGRVLLADPTGVEIGTVLPLRGNGLPETGPARETAARGESTGPHVKVLIGPEGGFSADEVALARDRGAEIVRLGENILRIETAAVAMATLCCCYSAGSGDSGGAEPAASGA